MPKSRSKCSWEPKVDEPVVVVVDKETAAHFGWSFCMRLGRVTGVSGEHVAVAFTNGDTYAGHLEDLRPLMRGET